MATTGAPPDAVSDLPEMLAATVRSAFARREYPAASSALEDHLLRSTDDPAALVCLASSIFEAACDTATAVVETCERALDLLARAGTASDATLHGQIRRVLVGERRAAKRRQKKVDELLARPKGELDYHGATSVAYALAPREPRLALEYYQLAEARADAPIWATSARNSQARCYHRLGEWDVLEPMLWAAIDSVRGATEESEGLDYSFVDTAFTWLLDHAGEGGDRDTFLELWAQCFEPDGAPLGRYFKCFPWVQDAQRRLLAHALEMDMPSVAAHLVELYATHRRKSNTSDEERALLDRARRMTG